MIDIDLLLAWGAAFKKVPKGNTIFSEGTTCSFYYQLVSGQVRWMNVNEEGKEEVVSLKETESSKPTYNFDSHSKS